VLGFMVEVGVSMGCSLDVVMACGVGNLVLMSLSLEQKLF
jgi:hypothetical protein